MPDGVHPTRHRMQPTHCEAVLNSTLAQPDSDQLPSSHNSMLFRCEPGYLPFNPPSPSRPTYIGGGDGLGGHRAMVSPATLRVVRSV